MTLDFTFISVFSDIETGALGNISAVFNLSEPLPSPTYQKIATDINQPASTFILPPEDGAYPIKWYAPDSRIGLCGHGTMAAIAYLSQGRKNQNHQFISGRDQLKGYTDESGLAYMVLDAIPIIKEIEIPSVIKEGLGIDILAMYETNNKHIVLAKDASSVQSMKPDFCRLRTCDIFGYAVTAPGKDIDFVSRTIVPHVQQLEDHATGSSHAVLTDFWSKKLNKNTLKARQLSPRGGLFHCSINNNLVTLSGKYSIISKGKYYLL